MVRSTLRNASLIIGVALSAMPPVLGAQPVEFDDGVRYEPSLQEHVARAIQPGRYSLGEMRPGLHVDDFYDRFVSRDHYTCFYYDHDLSSTCFAYLAVGEQPPLTGRERVTFSIDRRTGTVWHLAFRSQGANEAPATLEEVLAHFTDLWGPPVAVSTCHQWISGGDTSDLEAATVRLCEHDESPWQISVTQMEYLTHVREQYTPEMPEFASRGEYRTWYPVWRPHTFAGIEAGMNLPSLLAQLGARMNPRQCTPSDNRDRPVVACVLDGPTLRLGGHPTIVIARITENDQVSEIEIRTPWTLSRGEAEEIATNTIAELEGSWGAPASGGGSSARWRDAPFHASVGAQYDDRVSPEPWRVLISLRVFAERVPTATLRP
jgi:hypothetical protein